MSGPLHAIRALTALGLFTLSGCIERPTEEMLRPPAGLERIIAAMGSRSAGEIADQAQRETQQLVRRSASMTAPVLARAIRHGEGQAARAGSRPLPVAMQELLAPHFASDILSTTRWTIGRGRVDLGTVITEQFMDEGAIALNRQIVFSSERLTGNVWMWAHELAHVEQYRRLGVNGFAAAYIADWRAIEREATQRANKVTAAIRKAS
ncbi:uncharacterized protein DUF4157 [Blastomonas natatoria]|uniref:Uncharacterized protein DUF4157 n=1 Tax=Blastomonas natatoria TaxID=34015 RepID=A0A2V3URJ2_9SPHN|nr:DUF4157 domain-containing protein [Blastomonas natatoria]PXW69560.1 uncharacterized protein DUF4157 [Blastomonas natatoria]